MEIFITVLIAIIIVTIIAFLFRRKHIREIGRLENEKLQIQHKPILEEMTKVKQLNMTGETEEKFERWRNEWTEVMDIHMPQIDSLLFDVEDMVDRFRFGKATAIEKEIHEKTRLCDKKMNDILNELNQLIGSEEKNRIEIEKLKEQHRIARKTVLAHQHSFGMTADLLERELDLFKPKFKEYDELTDNGNYMLAREIVLSLTTAGERIFMLIHEIPTLLTELQNKIPSSIRELRMGMKEMEEQDYYLHHLEIKKQLDTIEGEIEGILAKMADLQIESVTQQTREIGDRIESFFVTLENEVAARHYVDENYYLVSETYTEVFKLTRETSDEAIFVQKSYRLDEKEAQIPQVSLKKLEKLGSRLDILSIRIQERTSANSSLEEELRAISFELEEIGENIEAFANRMKSLRIDENNVRIKLDELTLRLQQTDRLLHKGNMPGIPDEMESRLEEADEQIYIVNQSLLDVPLNIELAESYLSNAEKAVNDVSGKVEELLENVVLIEWIIQYGNRYRASNPSIHARLLQAEESFRQFRYAKALEEAATAVEEVEPGAMKRIQELVKEHV